MTAANSRYRFLDRWPSPSPPLLGAVFSFAILAAAMVSFQPTAAGVPSPLWLPAGLAVTIVLRRGPWFLIGLWLGCLAADLRVGLPPGVAILVEVGRVLEVALVVAVIRRWSGLEETSPCLRGMLVMVGGALLVGCPVGAAWASAFLALLPALDNPPFWSRWAIWWLGDAAGILLVTPVLLLREFWLPVPAVTASLSQHLVFRRALSLIATVLPAVPVAVILLLAHWPSPLDQMGVALTYLGFPVVVAAALWLETVGAAAVVGVIAVLVILGDTQRLGPFSGHDVALGLFQLEVYVVTLATTGLSLAAAMTERRQATEAMKRSAERLEAAERLAGIGWWQHQSGRREEAWSAGMFHTVGMSPHEATPSNDAFDALVHPEDLPRLVGYRESLARTADGEGIEFRLCLGDVERWLVCRHTIAPETRSDYFGIVKDITDQKHQTQALYEYPYPGKAGDKNYLGPCGLPE